MAQTTITLLDIIALVLAAIHFGVPLTYYYYMKTKYLNKPWNIKIDPNYQPKITIIIPTYNEAKLIQQKLDNIYEQEYPREKLEIIVIDSASTDGTPEKVKQWVMRHPDIKITLLQEPIRRGMVPALNYALKHVPKDNELVIFTDADAFWEQDTLKHVTKYFADPSIGAVTTCIAPLEEKDKYLETTYRNYYNIIRIGESKIHSTPIHNGALIAFRKELLEKIGGLPTYTGNNDSTPASLIAFMGYRVVQIDDTTVKEPLRCNQLRRKIRRAQHLILHFIHTKCYAKKLGIYRRSQFDNIWRIENLLHLVNPWLLIIASSLLVTSLLLYKSMITLTLLIIGVMLLLYKHFRVWIFNQLYLVIASIRNIKTKEISWAK